MHPILVDLTMGENFNIIVSFYRFFGILAAVYLAGVCVLLLRKLRINYTSIFAITLASVISFFLGARLLYAVLYLERVIENPGIITRLQLHNFALHGGLILSLLVFWIASKYIKIDFLQFTDKAVAHVGIAVAIMRMGCFLNGCCFGKPTDLSWGVAAPFLSYAHMAQTKCTDSIFAFKNIHPTQIYEMVAALVAVAAVILLSKKIRKTGVPTFVFLIIFSLGRLVVFFFRDFPVASTISDIIRGPVIYGSIIIICLFWTFKFLKKEEKNTLYFQGRG